MSDEDSSSANESCLFDLQYQFNVYQKPVNALITNQKSTQLIVASGSRLNFYDFHNLNNLCKPYLFTEWTDHSIYDLCYSPNNKEFISSGTSNSVRLYAANGDLLEEFVEGDPFIRDLTKTRGHVGSISNCQFHPTEHKKFATSSLDGTIRIWSVENQRKSLECIRFSEGLISKAYKKIPVSTFCLSNNLICAAGESELKFWDFNSHSVVAMSTKAVAVSTKAVAVSAKAVAVSAKVVAVSAKAVAVTVKAVAVTAKAVAMGSKLVGLAETGGGSVAVAEFADHGLPPRREFFLGPQPGLLMQPHHHALVGHDGDALGRF